MNINKQLFLLIALIFSFQNPLIGSQTNTSDFAKQKAIHGAMKVGTQVIGHQLNRGIDYIASSNGYNLPAEQAQIDSANASTALANEHLAGAKIDTIMKELELLKLSYSLNGKGNTPEAKIKLKRYEKLIDEMTGGKENDKHLPELTEEEKNEILNPKSNKPSDIDKKPGIFSKAFAPIIAATGYMNAGADYIADYSFGYFIESRNLNRFLVYSTIAGISYYIYKKYTKKDQPAFDLFDDTN